MFPPAPLTARDILNCLHEGLYVLDRQRRVVFWNQEAEHITGYSAHEIMGKSCADNFLMHVDEQGTCLCLGDCPVSHTLQDGLFREAEVFLHHKKGHRVPVAVRVTPLRDENGDITGAVEVFIDNSQRREERQRLRELEKLALLDGLTHIPNRRYLEEMAASRLAEFQRTGLNFGGMLMDLDHFKNVNDTHGHMVGDQVLVTVAHTLSHLSRPYDVVGRWGGEEFLALVPNIDSRGLKKLAERCRAMVERSKVECNLGEVCVTISVGASMVRPGDILESLVARADRLLYQAKQAGRNCVRVD